MNVSRPHVSTIGAEPKGPRLAMQVTGAGLGAAVISVTNNPLCNDSFDVRTSTSRAHLESEAHVRVDPSSVHPTLVFDVVQMRRPSVEAETLASFKGRLDAVMQQPLLDAERKIETLKWQFYDLVLEVAQPLGEPDSVMPTTAFAGICSMAREADVLDERLKQAWRGAVFSLASVGWEVDGREQAMKEVENQMVGLRRQLHHIMGRCEAVTASKTSDQRKAIVELIEGPIFEGFRERIDAVQEDLAGLREASGHLDEMIAGCARMAYVYDALVMLKHRIVTASKVVSVSEFGDPIDDLESGLESVDAAMQLLLDNGIARMERDLLASTAHSTSSAVDFNEWVDAFAAYKVTMLDRAFEASQSEQTLRLANFEDRLRKLELQFQPVRTKTE